MPKSLEEFGRELRKLINSPKVFALLQEGDWGAGGCWTLAQAVAEFLGLPATIMAVTEQREGAGGEVVEVPLSHVVVNYGDVYIDYNGAQTLEELMKNLEKEGYQDPGLGILTPAVRAAAKKEWGMYCDQEAKRELLKHLHARFG